MTIIQEAMASRETESTGEMEKIRAELKKYRKIMGEDTDDDPS